MAMTLDEQLLEILACPSEDHAPLTTGTRSDPDADALTCTVCGREFPIRDGIPVLLLDESTQPSSTEAAPEAVPDESDTPSSDAV